MHPKLILFFVMFFVCLFWFCFLLQRLCIILQTGACSSCQKHAQPLFIWKGAGCTQLTGLSGPWYHSYPFFSSTAFQVIPTQWIPVLDYCPSNVLACIWLTKSHLYFPTMCLISVDKCFFFFCPDFCWTLPTLSSANVTSVLFTFTSSSLIQTLNMPKMAKLVSLHAYASTHVTLLAPKTAVTHQTYSPYFVLFLFMVVHSIFHSDDTPHT